MFRFGQPLVEGVVVARPNRFTMDVLLPNTRHPVRCYCPVTGKIAGRMNISDVPCLLSPASSSNRRTPYTVEALSLPLSRSFIGNISSPPPKQHWVGINQTRANDYVAAFLESGALNSVLALDNAITTQNVVQREVRIPKPLTAGKSSTKTKQTRLDFLVNGDHYIEVKTPVGEIGQDDTTDRANRDETMSSKALEVWGERLIRHFNAVADLVSADPDGCSVGAAKRASVLLCYMYDAPPFQRMDSTNSSNATNPIVKAARHAQRRGVTFWQANMILSKDGVELIRALPIS